MILSRFFKPKWQHRDPQVRKQAVQSLTASDPTLIQIARDDNNPSVRRAALHRITDLYLLVKISQEDPESGVRETADAHVRKLMTGKEADSPALETRLAVLRKAEVPGLAPFLVTNGLEPALRLAALERIEDDAILGEIATKDPSGDVRFAALAQIKQVATLEQVAKQTRNRDKRVNRSARDRLEALRAVQTEQTHLQRLCAEMESLGELKATTIPTGRFRVLEGEWEKHQHAAAADVVERFQTARARFLGRLEASEAQRAGRATVFKRLEDLVANLRGQAQLSPEGRARVEDTLQHAQAEWVALGGASTYEEQKLAELLQAIRDRERLLHRNQERAERLRGVVRKAEELLRQASEVRDRELTDLKKSWGALERPEAESLMAQLQLQFDAGVGRLKERLRRQVEQRDQELAEIQTLIDALESALTEGALQNAIDLRDQARQRLKENISLSRNEMATLERRLHRNEPKIRELRGWRRWGTGQAREHLCEAAANLIGLEDDPLSIAKRIKQLRATWKSLDGLEGAASKTVWEKFNNACEQAYLPCQALFEAQTRERQAHLEKKQALCERLELLESNTDWEQADWRMVDRIWREARNHWHKIGPVDRAARKAIERRFERAMRRIDVLLDKERQLDLNRRKDLIQTVEELAQGDDLRAAIAGAKQAQSQWHPTVLASRREEQALWRQFRAACDAVFERRDNEHQAAEAERQANLARKITVCETLEALLTETGDAVLRRGRASIQEAEETWDSIGPVPRAAQKGIEQRFAAARKKLQGHRWEQQRARDKQTLESLGSKARICADVEALLVTDPSGDAAAKAQTFLDAWEALPTLAPELENLIRQRLDIALDALAKGGETQRALLDKLSENIEKKKLLCLRMDVLSGVETPSEFAQMRMEYQISRLSESLTTRSTHSPQADAPEDVHRIVQDWYLHGALPAALNDALEEWFNRALAVFYDQRGEADGGTNDESL